MTPDSTPANARLDADCREFRRRMEAAWFALQDYPTEALEAGAVARLVAVCDRAVANLDHLQEVWGKEAVTSGLAVELRAALAALKAKGD